MMTGTEAFAAPMTAETVRKCTEFPEWYWRVPCMVNAEPKYTDEWLIEEIRKLCVRIPVVRDVGNTAT